MSSLALLALLSALPAHADKSAQSSTQSYTAVDPDNRQPLYAVDLLYWCPTTYRRVLWDSDSLSRALNRFDKYDYDGDGKYELNDVSVLIPPVSKASSAHRYVVMLVDSRYTGYLKGLVVPDDPVRGATDAYPWYLYQSITSDSGWSIDTSELLTLTDLEDWADQLVAEGYAPIVLSTDMYGTGADEVGNDARTALAIREVLRYMYDCADTSAKPDRLEGVVLTGAFPEPAVLKVHWNEDSHRLLPEVQTLSGAVVYGDMDGKWEDTLILEEQRERYDFDLTDDSVERGHVLSASGMTLTEVTMSEDTTVGCGCRIEQDPHATITLRDGFLIGDASIEVESAESGVEGRYDVQLTLDVNRELSDSDRHDGLLHAVPELMVSRLDPSTVAFDPWNAESKPSDIPGVEIGMRRNPDGDIWVHEPLRELQMLKDYFDRNLSYRQGRDVTSNAVLSIAADGLSQHNRTVPAFIEANRLDRHRDSLEDGATLSDAVGMLSADARYKFVIAHSSPLGSGFERVGTDEADEEKAALRAAFPDGIWRWTERGTALEAMEVPMGDGWRSDRHVVRDSDTVSTGLELDLLRTHYEQSRAKFAPAAFYFHGGCHYASPGNMQRHVSNEGAYGAGLGIPGDRGFKQSSALLFFGNGLTVMARAKVFDDGAGDYLGMLNGKSSIGDLWMAGFVGGSKDTSEVYHGELSKRRAYNWSQEGDWTLPAGL